MCSITINPIADEVLAKLEKTGVNRAKRFQVRLFQYAKEATTERGGRLDRPDSIGSGVKDKYKPTVQGVRHCKIFGDHRVYIIGSHRDCNYEILYFKEWKKSNEMEENSEEFLLRLKKGREQRQIGVLTEDGTMRVLPGEGDAAEL